MFPIAHLISRGPMPQNKPSQVSFFNTISLFVIYLKTSLLGMHYVMIIVFIFSFTQEYFT